MDQSEGIIAKYFRAPSQLIERLYEIAPVPSRPTIMTYHTQLNICIVHFQHLYPVIYVFMSISILGWGG